MWVCPQNGVPPKNDSLLVIAIMRWLVGTLCGQTQEYGDIWDANANISREHVMYVTMHLFILFEFTP